MTTLDERSRARHLLSGPVTLRVPLVRDVRPATPARTRWQVGYRSRVLATDAVVVVAATAIAHLPLLDSLTPSRGAPGSGRALLVSACVAVLWLVALLAGRAYDERLLGRGRTEYRRLVDATWRLFGLLAVAAFLGGVAEARAHLVVVAPVGLLGLVTARYAWRQWLHRLQMRREGWTTRVLAVASRAQAVLMIERLNAPIGHGYEVVGVCVPAGDMALGEEINGVPVLGDVSLAGEAATLVGADAIVVSGSDEITSEDVRRVGWDAERAGADFFLAAELADVAPRRAAVAPAPGMSLVHVAAPRFRSAQLVVKHVLDWCGAALLTVLGAPVMMLVALAVVLDDPGSPFYLQRRVGRDGRTFKMVKFRTMRQGADGQVVTLSDANEAAGPLFKIRNDPRVTRLGRVLRRFSIDELPQLFNVLVGQMSLVGPRPPLEREALRYSSRMRRRLLVKPGLTGLWQVAGRSDLSWEESVRLDVFYAENWSLLDDALILMRTARAVVSGRGAY